MDSRKKNKQDLRERRSEGAKGVGGSEGGKERERARELGMLLREDCTEV